MVFKGTPGNWYDEQSEEYHLSEQAAYDLVVKARNAYMDAQRVPKPQPPRELFIHGKTLFNREEWAGFVRAVGSETNVVAVRIRDDKDLKLYHKSDNPVLRGIAYIRSDRHAYLWTRGWTPRLATYPGMGSP